MTTTEEIVGLLTEFLCAGGFFNPELMEKAKSQNAFLRARDALQDQAAEIDRLTAQLAAKAALLAERERDAARLDFVDEHFYKMPLAKDPLGWHLIVDYPHLGNYKLIGSFRDAIDAALEVGKEKGA